VDCRARSFFLSSRQYYLAGATLGEQGAERDLRCFAVSHGCQVVVIEFANYDEGAKSRLPPYVFIRQGQRKREPTSGLKNRLSLLQLRVCGQWLLGVAEVCKFRIDKGSSVLCVAHYCRVLHPG
jgi:hypothetical protein